MCGEATRKVKNQFVQSQLRFTHLPPRCMEPGWKRQSGHRHHQAGTRRYFSDESVEVLESGLYTFENAGDNTLAPTAEVTVTKPGIKIGPLDG